jgi:O-succinylbenzoate synthase
MSMIEKIEAYKVRCPLREPFRISAHVFHETVGIILKLTADDGTIGWGEAIHLDTPWFTHETLESGFLMIRDQFLPAIHRVQAASIEELRGTFKWVQGNNQTLGGIDSALADIAAQQAGLPLYRYLGGTTNRTAVGTSLGIKPEAELYRSVEKSQREGYRRIKIKIKPGNDVAIIAGVRSRFPDMGIMVDANAAYTMDDLPVFKKLDELGVLMMEQPLANGDLVDHASLQKHLKTPLCLDESAKNLEEVRHAAALGSARIINIKPPRVGGPGNVVEMLAFLRGAKLGAWIGGMMETGVGRLLNAACGTLAGINYPGDLRPPLDYLVEDIVENRFEIVDGDLVLDETPGLGAAVNEKKLKQFTVESFSLR